MVELGGGTCTSDTRSTVMILMKISQEIGLGSKMLSFISRMNLRTISGWRVFSSHVDLDVTLQVQLP